MLVDDPDSDPAYRKADGTVDEDRAGIKRADLFNLIEELVMWENSNNPDVIRTARAEIARCVAPRLKGGKPVIITKSGTCAGHTRPSELSRAARRIDGDSVRLI